MPRLPIMPRAVLDQPSSSCSAISLKDKSVIVPPYHFPFKAGSRACTATNLSNCNQYVILAQICLFFRVGGDPAETPDFNYSPYITDKTEQAYWQKAFGIRFQVRGDDVLLACMQRSQSRCQEELGYSIEYSV